MVRIALSSLALLLALLATPLASYASLPPPDPTPVPEPGTLALLGVGAGVAGVVGWVRGRRKK
jgi:hypothetical protein